MTIMKIHIRYSHGEFLDCNNDYNNDNGDDNIIIIKMMMIVVLVIMMTITIWYINCI